MSVKEVTQYSQTSTQTSVEERWTVCIYFIYVQINNYRLIIMTTLRPHHKATEVHGKHIPVTTHLCRMTWNNYHVKLATIRQEASHLKSSHLRTSRWGGGCNRYCGKSNRRSQQCCGICGCIRFYHICTHRHLRKWNLFLLVYTKMN